MELQMSWLDQDTGLMTKTVSVQASNNVDDADVRRAIAFLIAILKSKEPKHKK